MPKYADNTTEAMVGDVVECVTDSGFYAVGNSFTVSDVSHGSIWNNNRFHDAALFSLIRRADQPQPKEQEMPENTPLVLVKYPEPEIEWTVGNMPHGEPFTFFDYPQHVYGKHHDECVLIMGPAGLPTNFEPQKVSRDTPVRRIRFNPANKEPVFEVI